MDVIVSIAEVLIVIVSELVHNFTVFGGLCAFSLKLLPHVNEVLFPCQKHLVGVWLSAGAFRGNFTCYCLERFKLEATMGATAATLFLILFGRLIVVMVTCLLRRLWLWWRLILFLQVLLILSVIPMYIPDFKRGELNSPGLIINHNVQELFTQLFQVRNQLITQFWVLGEADLFSEHGYKIRTRSLLLRQD